jgi:peptidoglycan-N-acetylglucosamine deacetylase
MAGTGLRRFFLIAAVLVVGVVAAAAAIVLERSPRRPPQRATIVVSVDRHERALPRGADLASAAKKLGLHPRPGDLLDVDGRVLRAGVVPGSLLLNGRTARVDTRLVSGDRIAIRNGRDRREPLRRQRVPVLEGLPPEPEFVVSRVPSVAVAVRGAISHKVVATRVHPAGSAVTSPGVALTFDDGPSPLYTPRVLSVLRRLDAPASFFVVGYLADARPDLVRAELAAGMEVGNHTYNHPEVPPFNELPVLLRDAEIRLGAESIRRAGGDPSLLRPPAGSYSAAVARAAARERERVVLWSVDPGDWQQGVTAREIAQRVLAAVRPGSIVILHDGGGDRSATVAALPAIVNGIRRRGLPLVQP